jgi:hypothetical protein
MNVEETGRRESEEGKKRREGCPPQEGEGEEGGPRLPRAIYPCL